MDWEDVNLKMSLLQTAHRDWQEDMGYDLDVLQSVT